MIEYPCASVAQGIEHRSPKAGVARSNRAGGTMKIAGQMAILSGLFLLLGAGVCQNVPMCAKCATMHRCHHSRMRDQCFLIRSSIRNHRSLI